MFKKHLRTDLVLIFSVLKLHLKDSQLCHAGINKVQLARKQASHPASHPASYRSVGPIKGGLIFIPGFNKRPHLFSHSNP